MSTLVLFAAAIPFRAAVQLSDGTRLLLRGIDPGEEDDCNLHPTVFFDEFGIEIGSRARFLERSGANGAACRVSVAGVAETTVTGPDGRTWIGRDIFAMVLRRFIAQAERNLGIEIFRAVIVVPAGLADEDREQLIQAGHIAGCALVELKDVGNLLVQAHDSSVGQRHLLLHLDEDQMRVSLFRCGATETRAEVIRDLSFEWSGEKMVRKLLRRLAPDADNEPKIRQFLRKELPLWNANRAAETLIDSDSGSPQAIYLPASARKKLADDLIEQVRALMTLASVQPTQLDWIHLHGAWASGLAAHFTLIAPQARIEIASSSAATLELANPFPARRPLLKSTIFADRPEGARIAITPARRFLLLQAGLPLPSVFFDESFTTEQFFSVVGLAASASGDEEEVVQIGTIPLPRLFEQRQFSRFRVRVIADSDAYLVTQAELALDSNSHMYIHDKRSGTVSEVGEHVISLLQRTSFLERGRGLASL